MFLKQFLVIFTISLIGSNTLTAQDTLVRNAIVNAISTGNATQLSNYFDSTIDLKIPENEGNFSKKQATQIMKFFFQHNAPQEFVLEHQDVSNEGSTIFIGYYKTNEGKNFRTYILLKKITETELIRQIQFEAK